MLLAAVLLTAPACGSNGSGSPEGEGGVLGDSGATDAGGVPMHTEAGQSNDAGSAGPSDAGTSPPSTLGSIGSGPIMCMYADDGGFDASCPAGKVCCEGAVSQFDTCSNSFAECPCPGGGCATVGCASPADCPGMQCCADIGTLNMITATSCKPSCGSNALVVCSTPNDCKPAGPCEAYGGVTGTDISTCL
jgi:hypothetical protein